MRSLLSSTAHAAIAHAQHELHGAASQQVPKVVFPSQYFAQLNAVGSFQGTAFEFHNVDFAGKFHKSSAPLQVGQTVKIAVNEKIGQTQNGVTINSFHGTIGGKIESISADPQPIVTIVPSGHFTVSLTIAGHKVNMTVSANSNPLVITIDGENNFVFLEGSYQLTKPTGMTGAAGFAIEPLS
jgi:hypothetical protein